MVKLQISPMEMKVIIDLSVDMTSVGLQWYSI